jgi:hypothetical protein
MKIIKFKITGHGLVRPAHEILPAVIGVTQQNIDQMLKSNAPDVRRLLGVERGRVAGRCGCAGVLLLD